MLPRHSSPTAIVDFPEAPSNAPVRRVFGAPQKLLRAATLGQVAALIDEAEQHARSGGWAVGFVSYEASPAFDTALAAMPRGELPFAWFALFDKPGLEAPPPPPPATFGDAYTDTTEQEYIESVRRIRAYEIAGDVYQVNLTVPFRMAATGTPLASYERMRSAQSGAYSAFLDLGDAQVMSASPELFFDRRGSAVRCKPMKGTRPRGLTNAADLAERATLLSSEKDRAENTMIVDLVRNDLGRVAQTGTVRVTSLCEAERYPGVWQLTSTIEAIVAPDLPLSELFRTLFPSGSITGAPKIRATEIIRELEARPREVYCGAIGIIRPGGDATFNVAIRTAWTTDNGATIHLDAGGAVTFDSTAAAELAEVRTKLVAFTTPRVAPDLFTTLRVESGVAQRADRHLARLADSASYFGIPFDVARARALLGDAEREQRDATLKQTQIARARLTLRQDGTQFLTVEDFADDAPGESRPVRVADRPIDRDDLRIWHKTTDRRLYDDALAAAHDCFDVLLWNAGEEATEFTRGNLVVELDGKLWTPHASCGLLSGVLRGELLDSGTIEERVISLSDVRSAQRIWLINALRGWVPVTFTQT